MTSSSFLLEKLPTHEVNQRLAEVYPEMDVSAMETILQLFFTHKIISRAYSSFFDRYGLSDGKFALLAVLDERPRQALRPSELAERIGVSRAAITGIVDGLEQAGLIERQNAQDDRRTQTIQLTAVGIQLLEDMMPDHYQRSAQLLAKLSQVERTLLQMLLEKLRGGVDAILKD